jgi:hypothetical protein
MKYMLLMYADEKKGPQTAEEFQAAAPDWYAFTQQASAAGVLESNNGLTSVTNATTVRVRDGKRVISDGPFAETHEQLGGYIIVNCRDLDEAMAWAEKVPTAKFGSVEIRPLNVWSQNQD